MSAGWYWVSAGECWVNAGGCWVYSYTFNVMHRILWYAQDRLVCTGYTGMHRIDWYAQDTLVCTGSTGFGMIIFNTHRDTHWYSYCYIGNW